MIFFFGKLVFFIFLHFIYIDYFGIIPRIMDSAGLLYLTCFFFTSFFLFFYLELMTRVLYFC